MKVESCRHKYFLRGTAGSKKQQSTACTSVPSWEPAGQGPCPPPTEDTQSAAWRKERFTCHFFFPLTKAQRNIWMGLKGDQVNRQGDFFQVLKASNCCWRAWCPDSPRFQGSAAAGSGALLPRASSGSALSGCPCLQPAVWTDLGYLTHWGTVTLFPPPWEGYPETTEPPLDTEAEKTDFFF